jgi:FAD/FMN-containing dehydrogenase
MMLPNLTPELTISPVYQHYLTNLRGSLFSGEIRSDYAARLAVANDNSVYQVIPQAVIFPRHTDDIVIALKSATQDIQFAPRGGGTGTNGQSLSAGIIIDCSKYMRNILEVNLEDMWVRVQPGVVLDQLNQYLRPMKVHFAPEISPSNRATIGGMINTDACGIGSKILGRTSDHVLDLKAILANGDIIQSQVTFENDIVPLLKDHQALIEEKFFTAPRTLCGYNLLKSLTGGDLNLNYLLSGSEGTLAVISECKLKIMPIPQYKKVLVIKYKTFDAALRSKEITPDIQPLVIETVDEKLIQLARLDPLYFLIKDFI